MNTADAGITVARPRILEARRVELGTFSVGDEAVIEFGPGLQRFLALHDDRGTSIGEGGAFEWTIPVGAAGTAAYAAVEPAGFDGVNAWTGSRNVVRWIRACLPDETLIASCRIAALSRAATLPYRVYSRDRGDLVVEGEFEFVSVVRDARGLYVIEPRRKPDAPVSARVETRQRTSTAPAPTLPTAATCDSVRWHHLQVWSANAPSLREPPEAVQDPLMVLRPPTVIRATGPRGEAGAVWEWVFPRDLLRLLGHPVGGAGEPLGRRHHPYGRLLEGMGVYAALAIAGGTRPRMLEVEWWSPTRGAEDFRVRSTLTGNEGSAATSTHDIYEGERAVGTARVVTAIAA